MARASFAPFRSEATKAEYEAHARKRLEACPVPWETRMVETSWGPTCVRASGRVTDPALILLPGAGVGSLMWLDGVEELSAHHRTYALDIIGDIGFSVMERKVTQPEDYVDWLDEVLEGLVPEGPVSLLGVSLGGSIAAQYALHRPERAQRVVLLAPGGTVLRLSFGFFVRVMLLCVPIPGFGGAGPLNRILLWVFEDAARGDAACRARLERAIEDVQIGVRCVAMRPPPWPRVLDDDAWRGFSVPCLFLVGENEKIYSARAAVRRLSRVAPQVKTEILPGAGHDLGLVHPELIGRRVLEFLGGPGGAPQRLRESS
jgi:pimeloyl-ACP methyl ester carboxylesterase